MYVWNETLHSFLIFTREHTSSKFQCCLSETDSLGKCLLAPIWRTMCVKVNGDRLQGDGGAALIQYLRYGYHASPRSHPCNRPSIPMKKAHPLLCVPSAARWVGTFPIRQHTFRGRPALVSHIRPISVSSVNMGRARSRVLDSYRRPLIIIREVVEKRGLPIASVARYTFLLVAGEMARPFLPPLIQRRRTLFPGYVVYDGYMSFKSTLGGLKKAGAKAVDNVREAISGPAANVAKKTQDLSSTIRETVRPSLDTASKELPKTVQAISGEIGKAANGTKNAVTSHFEWVKKKVEGRWK